MASKQGLEDLLKEHMSEGNFRRLQQNKRDNIRLTLKQGVFLEEQD